jgi:hypothetical protein
MYTKSGISVIIEEATLSWQALLLKIASQEIQRIRLRKNGIQEVPEVQSSLPYDVLHTASGACTRCDERGY